MKTLTDKVVTITGAGAGIGRALAEEFAARGARLALSDVDLDAVNETATLCKRHGKEVASYHLDVTDRAAVIDHAAEIVRTFGAVNVIVNNAGVGQFAQLHEVSWEQLDRLLAINIGGVVNGTKAFLPHLIASGDGHVVNISSEFGLVGMPTQTAYCAVQVLRPWVDRSAPGRHARRRAPRRRDHRPPRRRQHGIRRPL